MKTIEEIESYTVLCQIKSNTVHKQTGCLQASRRKTQVTMEERGQTDNRQSFRCLYEEEERNIKNRFNGKFVFSFMSIFNGMYKKINRV